MFGWILLLILIVTVAILLCWHGDIVKTGGADDNDERPVVYTIGHSTTPIDDFIKQLTDHHVEVLIDVRTLPGSERYPQFNKESLKHSLMLKEILYLHMPELGGLRKPQPDSVNTGWRNKSFRGFADYMQTPEFSAALDRLKPMLAHKRVICIMCSEAVPWRCHRNLIGDALTARGLRVVDIIGKKTSPHRMTPFAHVEGTRVTYPGTAVKN